VSEELENSLQQAIETYLNDRLRAIDEQVSRLQADVTEALARLHESSASQNLEGTALSAAIFAHLQTARGQKLSGAVSDSAPQDAGAIKRAVEEIEQQQTQTEILKSLLKGSAQFAERVALLVVKNDQAIGWRSVNASDPANLQPIGGVSLPLSADTIVTGTVRSRSSINVKRANSNDQMLIDQLGGQPAATLAVPLIVRGKVVAVLYADSQSPDVNSINADALEVLTRVAGMAVNIASVQRVAVQPQEQPAAMARPVEAPSEPAPAPEAEAAPREELSYQPQVEAQVSEPEAVTAEVPVTEPPAEPETDEVAAPVAEPISEPSQAAPETAEAAAPETEAVSEPSPAPVVAEASAPEQVAPPPAESVADAANVEPPAATPETPQPTPFISQYSTPLGSARRYGVSEPDLPIEVSEEERRLHNDARRFARLLVSEIKLYNEPKVQEGRSNSDLYDRLREDIDRSRQMYDKRVAPPVAARHDYFHQELVNTLAEGDPAKLGASYPGAVASVN
jgi:hypothetical protein